MEDRILESHVIKWIKSVEVIDANLQRLENDEKQAYTIIRNIFGKNRPNMETVTNSCETLKGYLDGGVKDDVYTAVRDFLKTSEIGQKNFQIFKELLEDRGFFGSQPSGQTDFNGSTLGTASYRRVEIDGDIYEGMFLGDERVWKGKIKYENGDFYEGEWDNDGPRGEGVLIDEDGNRYVGRFAGLAGTGRIEYSDDEWYEGPWNEDCNPHGFGVMKIDDHIDKGEFNDGDRVGRGRIEWDNGDWYEGGWNNEGPNGHGVWKRKNYTEKGEYIDGCCAGKGRIEWNDGDWYEGGWNDNGPHGYGKYRIGNRIDTGQYKDGMRVGTGRMEWSDGSWYEGGWNEKGFHGKGTRYLASVKRTDEGEWDSGEAVGSVKMTWASGDIYAGTWSYKADQLNGVGTYYTAARRKTRSGQWINGVWHNDWATPRNIIGVVCWVAAAISIVTAGIIPAIILGVIGKVIYEGK